MEIMSKIFPFLLLLAVGIMLALPVQAWEENTITWNNQPNYTAQNQNYTNDDFGTGGWKAINVTDMVQDAKNAGLNTIGFRIDKSPLFEQAWVFDSRETSNIPYLLVNGSLIINASKDSTVKENFPNTNFGSETSLRTYNSSFGTNNLFYLEFSISQISSINNVFLYFNENGSSPASNQYHTISRVISTTYDPSGYVNNSAGNMVSGATVRLSNATWNSSTTSNSSGYWNVNIYANGDYNYTVSKNEYTTLTGNQTFTVGGTNYNFTLSCLGGISVCSPPPYNVNGFNVLNYDMQFNGKNLINLSWLHLLSGGGIVFPDGTTQTTASVGGGGNLTNATVDPYNMNASNLTSGTIPNARLNASYDYPNSSVLAREPSVTGSTANVFWNGLKQWIALSSANISDIGNYLLISTYSGNFPNSTVAGNLNAWNATYNSTYDGANRRDASINFLIDNGTNVIATGIKGDVEIPFSGTIVSVRLLANETGDINISLWRDTYANFPPTSSDFIGNISFTSSNKAQDTTLSGWNTTIVAGDILRYNVESVSTIQRITVSIVVRKA